MAFVVVPRPRWRSSIVSWRRSRPRSRPGAATGGRGPAARRYAESLTSLIDTADPRDATLAKVAPGQIFAVGMTVAQTIMAILTLLTVVYFWLTERARLQRYALAFIPQERRGGAHDAWNAARIALVAGSVAS